MNYENLFAQKIQEIKKANLFRTIPEITAGAEKYITIEGKKCLNLASNNYLGLSLNEKLKTESIKAINKYGCSSSASRIVTGNYSLYTILEEEIAKFKGYEKGLILGSGYVANLSIISAICDNKWIVFSDRLNHASIIDGIKLSGAKHVRYKHNDMDHLRYSLKKYDKDVKKLIVTDTVFSMDGDTANLIEIVKLAKDYQAIVMVDEAHATGIFGKGRGLVHELGMEKEIDINMGTFSKGLGSFGAYVCASKTIIEYLINKSRGFIFSTSLPPSVIGANLAAIELLKNNYSLGLKLINISEIVRKSLASLGFNTLNSSTQIIPVIIGDRKKLFMAKDFLIKKGVFAAAIRPPSVPINTERLRISLRADLTDDELNLIIQAFKELSQCL
ncbi:8-amino-7-oxononanoate synthase [Deferribacter autotrophicus]|uniref:8-amino-7-ketopelargonate synthase n=1 Tax=Deferribacter autotrophicus TaxID=500465 RepID=A0A5A8F652_9BACT|nr:8-amino-7-oxononanoate synthase [Deferribacter autotrophicus]